MSTPMTIDAVNALDRDAFVAALGWIVEDSPWVAAQAYAARPFRDRAALHAAMVEVMASSPAEAQLTILRAHPDLAGKAAVAGELTPSSTREQSSAGLDRLTPEELAEFTRLNSAYSERFGFPFVICVREHDKGGVLRAFRARLANDREVELRTAIGEVAKIAALRLTDAVA